MDPHDCSSSMRLRVLVTMWTLVLFSVLVVGIRLYTQARVIRKFQWTDPFIFFALVTAIISTAFNSAAIANGLGTHMACLTTAGKISAMQWKYFGILPGAFSAPSARISFCLYMLPFGGLCKKWKACFWAIIISQSLVNLGYAVGAMVTCILTSPLWGVRNNTICWASNIMVKISIAQGSFNAATDLILTIMPFMVLRKLNMARSTKIALSILMSMSIFTMAACVLETVELYRLTKSVDMTYVAARFMIWVSLERYIAIIAVSIPMIRPLALHVLCNRLNWFGTPKKSADRLWVERRAVRLSFESGVALGRERVYTNTHPAEMTLQQLVELRAQLGNNFLVMPDRALV